MTDVLPNQPPARATPDTWPMWKIWLTIVGIATLMSMVVTCSQASWDREQDACYADYQSEGASKVGVSFDDFDDTCY